MSNMYLLSLTVHSDEINSLKPLLHIEEELDAITEFQENSLIEITKCKYLLKSLKEFPLSKFALRQHRRILDIIKKIDVKVKSVPPDDPLHPHFVHLSKIAIFRFIAYRNSQGITENVDLWKDVALYKWMLMNFPLKLCYIADENTLRKFKIKKLTPDQQNAYEKCKLMKTSQQFDAQTNVRLVITAELREHLVNRRIYNIFTEIRDRMEHYIENIFKEYVPIPEAWTLTLLSQVTINDSFSDDEVQTSEDGASVSDANTVIEAPCRNPQISPPKPDMLATKPVENEKSEALIRMNQIKELFDIRVGAYTTSLLHRNNQFIELTMEKLQSNPNAELVFPSIDDFCRFHLDNPSTSSAQPEEDTDVLSPQFSPILSQRNSTKQSETYGKTEHKQNPAKTPEDSFEFVNNTTVEFAKENIQIHSAHRSKKNAKGLTMNAKVEEVTRNTATSEYKQQEDINPNAESIYLQSAEQQHIKSEPLSQSGWSQDVEILEPNSTEIIEIEDCEDTTQDLIDNLMTPGMGQMVTDDKDLLQDLMTTPPTTVDDIHSPLNSPPVISPDEIRPSLESHKDISSKLTQDEDNAKKNCSENQQGNSPDSVHVKKASGAKNRQHFFENPLEKTQIIRHTFAPLEVAVLNEPIARNVPIRQQTARRGRCRSGGGDHFVTKRRFKNPKPTSELIIEDASICDQSLCDGTQSVASTTTLEDCLISDGSKQCTSIHITDQLNLLTTSTPIAPLTVHISRPLVNRKYFLKLAHIKEATLTAICGSEIHSSVHFVNQFVHENLTTESTRLLLQLPGIKQWSALCALVQRMNSFTFVLYDETARTMRRPIPEQVLCLLFKSRNYFRDGLVITPDSQTVGTSQAVRFMDINERPICLENALSPKILDKLKQRKEDVKRKRSSELLSES